MTQYINMWKNAFNFKGTATRSDYWMAILFNFIAAIVLVIIGMVIGTTILTNLYSLAVLIPGIAIVVRRLHDIGKSGFWYFIILIPLVGWVWILILLCTPSTTPYQTEE